MKIRKLLALTLCVLLLATILAGCAADSATAAAPNEAYNYGYDSALSGSAAESANTDSVSGDRKLIRTISMDAETEDMDALLEDIQSRVAQLGGYIESRNVQNGSQYASYRYRYATLVIRLPADQLDSFLLQVESVSNVVSAVEDATDVTLQYAATESRLAVLRTEEARLMTFLSEAETVTELLEIEERLTDVQSEIESITTQLNTYDNLIDYGTITLDITEVEVYTVVEEDDPTMWQQISERFCDSIQFLMSAGRGLIVFLLGSSPYLILLAVIITVIVLVSRPKKRKKNADQTPPPPATE